MAKQLIKKAQPGLYRKKKLPEYRSFRLSRRIKPENIKKLPSVRVLWEETWRFIWRYRLKMLIFSGIYLVLYVVLVKGLNSFSLDIQSLKGGVKGVSDGYVLFLASLLNVYARLVSSVGAAENDMANFFQASIFVICTLAYIWLIRKLHGRNSDASVKDAFYRGPQPLVPFLLVLVIMTFQVLPAGFGGLLLAVGQGGITASGQGELFVLSLVALLCITLSVYLITGSFFALYIVTLPGTHPIVAVRSSLHLLRVHRWQIVWRLAAFFLALLAVGFLLTAPFIIWLPKYVEYVFFALGMSSFVVAHTYVYKLYRSML